MRNDRATGVRRLLTFVLPVAVVLTLGGCSSGVGDTDTGGVALVVSQFDGLPSQVSVNDAAAVGLVTVDEFQLESIVENPNQGVSDLQTIELRTYEVRYSRADSGQRVPTPLVERIFSTVPPGGTSTFNNLPILRNEQLLNPPLSDLLFVNGGFDTETGSEVIRLNFHVRFFGRTLGGRDVVTSTQSFTVDFVP
jgi:hypothetical protein